MNRELTRVINIQITQVTDYGTLIDSRLKNREENEKKYAEIFKVDFNADDVQVEIHDFLLEKEEVLKPCPFCGGKAMIFRECNHFRVLCDGECSVNPVTYGFDTEEEAIEKWNKRGE